MWLSFVPVQNQKSSSYSSSSFLIPAQLFNSCTQQHPHPHPLYPSSPLCPSWKPSDDSERSPGLLHKRVGSGTVSQDAAHRVWICASSRLTHPFIHLLPPPVPWAQPRPAPVCIAEATSHQPGFHYTSQTEPESFQRHASGRSGF